MGNVGLFLDLYNELETVLKATGRYKENNSVIMSRIDELYKKALSKDRSYRLDAIRQIRNILIHESTYIRKYMDIQKEAIDFLESEIKRIDKSQTALNIMISYDNVYYCENGDDINDVIAKMREKHYTSIPILKEKRVIGIFTEKQYVSNILSGDLKQEIDYTQYSLNGDYAHYYDFVSKEKTVEELEDLFEEKKDNKRLGMLFVTQSGNSNEKILGIITVYDVIENN